MEGRDDWGPLNKQGGITRSSSETRSEHQFKQANLNTIHGNQMSAHPETVVIQSMSMIPDPGLTSIP